MGPSVSKRRRTKGRLFLRRRWEQPSRMKPMDQAQERRSTSSTAGRVLRDALVALVPPALAFGGEVMFFSSLGARWLLMVAAVIVSAANGGMLTGLVAT